jgi:hypothetical protein
VIGPTPSDFAPKGLTRASPFIGPMERGVSRRARTLRRVARRMPRAVFLSTVIGAVLLASPVATGGMPPPIWTSASIAWTNGAVSCTFQANRPGMNASAAGTSDAGLYVGLGQLEELAPNGTPVAMASMTGNPWTLLNQSWGETLVLAYGAGVPEFRAASPGVRTGTVEAHIGFSLPAYSENAGSNASSVTMEVQFSNWSWQAPGDSLSLRMLTWPEFNGSEHLEPGARSSVMSVSNQTGAQMEYFQPNSMATVTLASGATRTITAQPTPSLRPDHGTVQVAFGPSAGEYRSLQYTAVVGVALPAEVFGIPLYEYAAIGAVAAASSMLIALGVRSVRRRPSDLIYDVEAP